MMRGGDLCISRSLKKVMAANTKAKVNSPISSRSHGTNLRKLCQKLCPTPAYRIAALVHQKKRLKRVHAGRFPQPFVQFAVKLDGWSGVLGMDKYREEFERQFAKAGESARHKWDKEAAENIRALSRELEKRAKEYPVRVR
jgi:hypothetical protein